MILKTLLITLLFVFAVFNQSNYPPLNDIESFNEEEYREFVFVFEEQHIEHSEETHDFIRSAYFNEGYYFYSTILIVPNGVLSSISCKKDVIESFRQKINDFNGTINTSKVFISFIQDRFDYICPGKFGRAEINGNYGVVFSPIFDWKNVGAHEFGHLIGLVHPVLIQCDKKQECIRKEYGDPYDIMGNLDFSSKPENILNSSSRYSLGIDQNLKKVIKGDINIKGTNKDFIYINQYGEKYFISWRFANSVVKKSGWTVNVKYRNGRNVLFSESRLLEGSFEPFMKNSSIRVSNSECLFFTEETFFLEDCHYMIKIK